MSIVEELPEDVQQRMIEKLPGKVNAERIKSATKGFRPTPVIVAYEYYQLPKQHFRNWRIDRSENGRKGFTVKQVTIGLQPTKAQREQARVAGKNRRKTPSSTN